MTIAEEQLADVSVAITWSFAAAVMLLGYSAKALWANIVTSVIVGGVTTAGFVEARFTLGQLAERVERQANTKVWIVSRTPQLWVAVFAVALAFAAILLSFRGLRSGKHRFWAAWLLNAPSVLLAVLGLWATSFR